MTTPEIHSLFAYNQWANARIFDAAGLLSEELFARTIVSSFPSIRDTLAHIVAAEWLWLRRWKGESPSAYPEWTEAPALQPLRHVLTHIEAERAAFLATLDEPDLEQSISYRNFKGEQWTYTLGDMFLHLINHSTYHRGQVVTMLRQVGSAAPSSDLLLFRDELKR